MSEEVGKKVAEMLLRDNVISSSEPRQSLVDLSNWMKAKLTAAQQGLNKTVREPVLVIVGRSDGFQFNFGNQLTLVVKVGPNRVGLEPSRSNTENPGKSAFEVSSTADGYEFRGIPLNPTVRTSYMTGDEFIEGVIKVACNKNFDAK